MIIQNYLQTLNYNQIIILEKPALINKYSTTHYTQINVLNNNVIRELLISFKQNIKLVQL